jgi:hypothetical protein
VALPGMAENAATTLRSARDGEGPPFHVKQSVQLGASIALA